MTNDHEATLSENTPYTLEGCGFGGGPFGIADASGKMIATCKSYFRDDMNRLLDLANKQAQIEQIVRSGK